MNRRDFLKSLGAAFAATALPVEAIAAALPIEDAATPEIASARLLPRGIAVLEFLINGEWQAALAVTGAILEEAAIDSELDLGIRRRGRAFEPGKVCLEGFPEFELISFMREQSHLQPDGVRMTFDDSIYNLGDALIESYTIESGPHERGLRLSITLVPQQPITRSRIGRP